MSRRTLIRLGIVLIAILLSRAAGRWGAHDDAGAPPAGAPAADTPADRVPTDAGSRGATATPDGGPSVARLAEERVSNVIVSADGEVTRLLEDDDEGSRHQKFILTMDDGHTVLVSHNIDLAPRVPLRLGDRVGVRGEYEWNPRGGVIHWTHHTPRGDHEPGWIEHDGRRYD